jgi:hypothetical protein
MSKKQALLDNFVNYACLNKPDLIGVLKESFKFIKESSYKVTASEVDVLQCHYDLKEQLFRKAHEYGQLQQCHVYRKGMKTVTAELIMLRTSSGAVE